MPNLLSYTESECTRCGDCAAACPMAIVRVGSRGPRTVPDAEARCLLCGHCIAACPVQTLRHANLPGEECQPLEVGWRGEPAAVEQLIKGRRSIRRFQPKPVDRATLLRVLDTARFAPTARNSQTVRWLVVHEADEVRRLASATIDWMRTFLEAGQPVAGRYDPTPLIRAWEAGYDPILRSAPHVLVAYGREGDGMAQASCVIALTTVELAALPHGLGTCWAGLLHMAVNQSPGARAALGLPEGHVMHGGLMIGYPLEKHYCIPPRKPLDVLWR